MEMEMETEMRQWERCWYNCGRRNRSPAQAHVFYLKTQGRQIFPETRTMARRLCRYNCVAVLATYL